MRITATEPVASGDDITPIDSPARRRFFRAAMAIVALEPLLLVVILMAMGAPLWIVACIIVVGAGLVAGVFWVIGALTWKPWQRRYPAQPILHGAVSQQFQSFGLGRLSRLNNCVTIIADEQHLHLVPFAALRWVGCGRMSLPLDRIGDVRPGWMPRFQMSAQIDGQAISGPEWCLKLADSGDA
jgi:hypothetical protein